MKYGITSESVQALVLTIFLLAWAVGPLLFGPISELYGRRLIFNISSVIFTVFSVACIFARSTEELILFRFLAGVGASTPISIAAAVIADMYDLADRGTANAIYGFGLLIGPPIGPLIGGYIIQDVEVKYAFILTASLSGLACILGLLFFDETHHRIIQQQLEKSTWLSLSRWRQSPTLVDASNKHDAAAKYSSDELRWSFRKAFMPLILLYESKICMILSLYGALCVLLPRFCSLVLLISFTESTHSSTFSLQHFLSYLARYMDLVQALQDLLILAVVLVRFLQQFLAAGSETPSTFEYVSNPMCRKAECYFGKEKP